MGSEGYVGVQHKCCLDQGDGVGIIGMHNKDYMGLGSVGGQQESIRMYGI